MTQFIKISILILALLFVRQSGSQVKLGFEAGMNLSNTTLSTDDEKSIERILYCFIF